MVLEAVEDYLRGWRDNNEALGQERVARGQLAIEHVMPRRWQTHWPLEVGDTEENREARLHLLGNLTLLTGRLNSKVSNGPWSGTGGKREGLNGHDVLLLNREIVRVAENNWTNELVKNRTRDIARIITQIWQVPKGHKSGFSSKAPRVLHKQVGLSDLIAAGVLKAGASLFPKRKKYNERVAILLPDGRLEIDGVPFAEPNEAAAAIVGERTSGWRFFLVDLNSKKSLRDVRQDYVATMALDTDDDGDDDGDDD
jgi:hypothetical protein